MDVAPTLILYLGWIFFAGWGLVLLTVSVIAFRQDLVPVADQRNSQRR